SWRMPSALPARLLTTPRRRPWIKYSYKGEGIMTGTSALANRKKRKLTIAKAISEAIAQEMTRDSGVFVMGEDIAKMGGVFGNTQGLLDKFGPERVRDTPISETGFIGMAVGAAALGLRPVVEL